MCLRVVCGNVVGPEALKGDRRNRLGSEWSG